VKIVRKGCKKEARKSTYLDPIEDSESSERSVEFLYLLVV
jgi:hypothetical protein